MRAVVVGAGAIGTVYARHLQKGGADVSFLVRPGRAARARRGIAVTPLNEQRVPVLLRCPAATAPPMEVDLVVLAVPSDALQGAWVDDLLRATAGAMVLLLSPGLDDRERVLRSMDPELLVQGRITAIAWDAPLPGEALWMSLAYWLPPGRAPLWGPRAARIADVLSAGGLPSRVVANEPSRAGSAVLTPLVAALSGLAWSFDGLTRSGLLPVVARAIREALRATDAPWWTPLVRGPTLRLLLGLAPLAVPFPLEAYVRRHFARLDAQTALQLDAFIVRSDGDSGALQLLRQRLVGTSRPDLSGWGLTGAPRCTSTSS